MFGLGNRNGDHRVRRILIVEDEPLVAFDNEYVLHEAGYTIVATLDVAEDALRTIAAGGIDLVMADVNLRGKADGVEVARSAHAAGMAVLFVSGECPVEARSLAVGCLAKPFSARDLLAAIEAVSVKLGGGVPKRVPKALTLY